MVPDWAVSVMFYGLLLLIISALIAEFRGTLGSGDAAADGVRDEELRLPGCQVMTGSSWISHPRPVSRLIVRKIPEARSVPTKVSGNCAPFGCVTRPSIRWREPVLVSVICLCCACDGNICAACRVT
jgi:hypothetical protein